MNVNIYVNGKQVTPQQQRELVMKNEVISKIVHSATARYDHPSKEGVFDKRNDR